MKQKGKRLGALLLALVMVLSMVPGTALAARVRNDEVAIDAPEAEVSEAAPVGVVGGEATLAAAGDADDATNDVGYTEGSGYSNPSDGATPIPNGTVIKATAASWSDVAGWNDRYPYCAVDGNTGGDSWHTRYSNGTHANAGGDNQDVLRNRPDLRYLQLEIVAGVEWLTALRYYPKNGSGRVGEYAIKTSDDGEHWSTVATGTNSTNNAWVRFDFDYPVHTKYVRLYAVTVLQSVSSGNDCMSAMEVRLVKTDAPASTRTVAVTVQNQNNQPVPGATVMLGGRTATTGDNGIATISELPENQALTAEATAADHGDSSVAVGATDTTATITLQAMERTISGTVTTNGTTPLKGAKVELLNADTNYTRVADVKAVTTGDDGTYSLNVNSVAAGSYKVRVSMDGHGAKILDTAIAVAATELVEAHPNNDVELPAIDTSNVTYLYDMTTEEGHRPSLGQADGTQLGNGNAYVGLEWTDDGKMKLDFKARQSNEVGDVLRMNRLVKLLGTNVKNGTIEFDATHEGDYPYKGRLGLALRLTDNNHWVYVGLENSDTTWFHERWNGEASHGSGWSNVLQGPSFTSGDTRHFKVTINEGQVSLWIDGIAVFTNANIGGSSTYPTAAADVGFICGNGKGGAAGSNNEDYGVPCSIIVDNLYVTRDDTSAAVTVAKKPTDAQGTVSAKRFTSAGELNLATIPGGATGAFQGDPVRIYADGLADNHVLDSLNITKADGTALTETEKGALNIAPGVNADNNKPYIAFEMPNYAIKVEAVILPVLTGVEIKGADSESEPVLKVGKSLSAVVKSGDTAVTSGVVYKWYHQTSQNQPDSDTWTACTSGGTPIQTDGRGILENDLNKKIKVEVTGDGENYASSVAVTATTTGLIGAADVPLQSAGLTRHTITMVMNDNTVGTTGDTVSDMTILTVNVTPSNATLKGQKVTWSMGSQTDVDGRTTTGVIALQDINEEKQIKVIASKPGTATVKVKVYAEVLPEGTTEEYIEDTVTIYVTKKLKGITVDSSVTADENGRIVIYANDTAELTEGKKNSVDLTAVLNPTDATDVTLNWNHPGDDGEDGDGVALIRATGNDKTVTVRPVGVDDAGTNIDTLNLADHTVTVTQAGEGTGLPSATVTIRVKRLLAHEIGITNGEAPKIGDKLTADIDALQMKTDSDGNKPLSYKWQRTKNGSTTDIDDAEGAEYTVTVDDLDATITLTVTATGDFYEGSKSATTGKVTKKAAPAAPTGLSGTAPSSGTATDGKITGLQAGKTYQYAQKTGETAPTGENDWTELTATTELASGNYWVRIAETTDTLASAAATVEVPGYEDTRKAITVSASIQNGSVTTNPTLADENDPVTITVVPDEGYVLETLTVTDADGGAVSVTDNNSFTMPAKAVTVTATFKKQTFTITHVLTNVACSKGTSASHDAEWGDTTAVVLTKVTGYALPVVTNIQVKAVDAEGNKTDLASTAWSYDRDTGTITITGGVKQNLEITASGAAERYNVTYALTNGLASSNSSQATYNTAYTTTLSAQGTTYALPDSITVTRGGTTLVAGTDYTYSSTSGEVTINASAVTGALTITAQGKSTAKPLTAVSIAIQHKDTSTTETTIPHVGDTLRANPVAGEVTTGITATYEWFVGGVKVTDVADSSGQSYVVRPEDETKTIVVKATGTGSYSTTVESAATPAVKIRIIPATNVTLDQHQASVQVGGTVTLVATLDPEDANTNNTVTWTSDNEEVATVANGVVTTKKPGTANITASIPGGHEDGCTVTVTAIPVVSVSLTGTAKVGEELTAEVNPEGATVTYKWERVNATTGALVATLSNTEATYTIVEADATYKIKVTATGTGNYAGTPSATTETAVLGEGEDIPTFGITVADGIENGTVSADKAEAAAGTKINLTITPAAGYALDTLTVTDEDGAAVTVTDNKFFTMPAKAVTVTATFEKIEVTGISFENATASVKVGSTTQLKAILEPTGAVGELTWASSDDEVATVDGTGKVTGVAVGTATITVKVSDSEGNEFTAQCTVNVSKKSSGSSRPATTTTTETKEDGSTVTTVTDNRTGATVETTEKPDGTKEIVETKPDGTVTETVETPDGVKESVETKPDGTVTETTITPDGAKESVETKPDGTVTETVIDAEGAMTEKVTDPDENVVITVTDPEGEELAKVEIPAEVPASNTTFVDTTDHWAKASIDKMAALKLVEGVGDDQYKPADPMTRGSLATVLHRLSNGKTDYQSVFADVDNKEWYAAGVAWAAKANVVKGISEDMFAPDEIITREQLATMLCRYAKLVGMDTTADASALNAFTDGGKTGSWAVDSMAWCVKVGILEGRGNNILDPNTKVNRAEVAVMLDRFIALLK